MKFTFDNLKNILDKRIGSRDLIKFDQSYVIKKFPFQTIKKRDDSN